MLLDAQRPPMELRGEAVLTRRRRPDTAERRSGGAAPGAYAVLVGRPHFDLGVWEAVATCLSRGQRSFACFLLGEVGQRVA